MLDVPKLLRLLNVNSRELKYLLDNINDYYYCISHPKLNKKTGLQLIDRNGKPRTRDIYPTLRQLKEVQKRIYHILLKTIKLPDYAFGGVKKRDNILNAKMHQGNVYFFVTDLRNFYPGITHNQIFELFINKGFAPKVASILTKLTTFKGMLPQGTTTAPYLANLVFTNAGLKLQELTAANKFTFTTFVDDITISAKSDFKPMVNEIVQLITDNGFKISHDKTHYQKGRPKVTNVIVGQNGLSLDKAYKMKIEAFEDKSTPQAVGTINYYERVEKISKTRKKVINQMIASNA
ncbi:reverse transcriptase family protein [Mucilaginibacter sp. SMC90]|uniref:reverse transcriptase family protein n=1 Tax=Mucilaginibacter sp. SMC90 TaxID=2929803 RepID=UPI001FB3F5B2|nr:reverse transcriptase family protein [Mucilaginibacter sp. SMC90]UOE52609.1 reverse transcriptase family protein [Mucilaginibacter sp. SMC90]